MYIDFFVRILFCIFFFFCCSIFMLVQKIPFSVHKFNCTLAHLFRSVHFECMSFCFVSWRAGQASFVECYLGASTDIRCRSVVWLTFKMFGANIYIYTTLTAMPHNVIANMIYQVVIYCIIFMHLWFEDWSINYWLSQVYLTSA